MKIQAIIPWETARLAAGALSAAAALLAHSWGQEPPQIEIDPPPLPQDDPAFVEEIMEDIDPGLLDQLAKVLGNDGEIVIDNLFADDLADPALFAGMVGGIGMRTLDLSSGMVKTDTDAEALLERAEAFAGQGRYDLASRLWQQAIDQSSDALIERAEWRDQTYQGNTYYQLRPMISEIEASMSRTIKGGLAAYQLKIDGDARALLARSSPETRESALAEVILRYFLSSIGDEAAFELGCLKMERGEFLPAVRLFAKILDEYPNPSVDPVEVEIRLAGSLARVGSVEQALQMVDGLYDALPEKRRILSLVRKDIESVGARSGGDTLSRAVLTTPLGVQTSLAQPTLPPILRILWTQDFELTLPQDWPLLPESARDPLPKLIDSYQNSRRTTPAPKRPPLTARWQAAFMPAGQILVREGRLFFKTDDRLVACDSETGSLQWLGYRNGLVLDETTRRYRSNSVALTPYPNTPEEYLLFGDLVHQSMTLDKDSVYVLEGPLLDLKEESPPVLTPADRQRQRFGMRGANAPGRFRENRLVAYDAGSGKLKWYRGAGEPLDPNLPIPRRAGFSRAPIPYSSLLLVPVHEESSLWVAGLNAQTGDTLWRTFLCDEPAGECQGLSTVAVTVDGGDAYVGSGAGLLFSVDAISGKLNWAVRYPRRAKRPVSATNSNLVPYYGNPARLLDGWHQDRLLAHGNEILVAGSDFDQLFAVNRRTGELAWEAPQQPFRSDDPSTYVLSVHDGRIYVGGRGHVRCYQARGGKMVWEAELPSKSFARGAFTPEAIYVPLQAAIAQLDPDTGSIVAVAQVPPLPDESEPVGNLFTDGERLIVYGLKKVYVLAPPDSVETLN